MKLHPKPGGCLAALMAGLIALPTPAAEVDLVRVLKGERKLQLIASGRVEQEFPIVLGRQPVGPKRQEGDGRTPEGVYQLDAKREASSYYKAIHISYPSPEDAATARRAGALPGGQIMIHGQRNGLGWLAFISQRFDWTDGSIALGNADMDQVWAAVKPGTTIVLRP